MSIQKKIKGFMVQNKDRKNQLSLIPGGKYVKLIINGKIGNNIYNKVKSPYLFYKKAQENNSRVNGYVVYNYKGIEIERLVK